MTPEQMLAGLQDEVRGLSETVQRLASENETLRSQSTVGAVRTVTMANEVARLNKPTAFSDAEEEYSDWEFALTCFVGTMDGTLLTKLRSVAANPRVKRVPTDEAGNLTWLRCSSQPSWWHVKSCGDRPESCRSVSSARCFRTTLHVKTCLAVLQKHTTSFTGDES